MLYPYYPQIERTRFPSTHFQSCISEWNRLDVSKHSCTIISKFKRKSLLHIRHFKRSNFLCSSPFCSCQIGTEYNDHFVLHCPHFSPQRRDLLDLLIRSIDFYMCLSPKKLTTLFLYGHPNLSTITNQIIMEGTLRLSRSTGIFETT